MNKKLYVGNIPYSMNEGALEELFSQCGTVDSVKIIKDKETDRSKGFGFVEMSSDTEANDAIEKLNGSEVDGRALRVSEAKPRPPRDGGNRGGGGYGGGRPPRY